MSCDCQDKRWVEWVRVSVENKAMCSVCGRDIPKEVIDAEDSTGYLDSLNFRGVKSLKNGKTP